VSDGDGNCRFFLQRLWGLGWWSLQRVCATTFSIGI
jgi:hypothetical protein